MKYIQQDNKIIMKNFDSFNIEQILECGQCFRFEKIEKNNYVIVAFSKVLNIVQKDELVEFYPCTIEEFENIWIDYFDLETDYSEIKSNLESIDDVLKEAIKFAPGIRILNQEPWECLISFIISQNNRIPMIKQVIKNISEKYGDKTGEYYLFPTIEQLSKSDYESLKLCKAGFRAKYILDAIEKVSKKDIDFKSFKDMDTESVRQKLISINGVGPKVADCTLLFSIRRREVFPTDVWVKRVMEHFYFEGNDTNIKKIHEFAKEKFGEYAGFAQQYLFYYAREQKIGAK